VWIEEASVIITARTGGATLWQGVVFDVTARREAEEERNRSGELLVRADAQRRQLLGALVSAREAERKRLAAEIHDGPVQKMTAIALRLGALLRASSDPAQRAVIEQLQSTVELSIARLRALIRAAAAGARPGVWSPRSATSSPRWTRPSRGATSRTSSPRSGPRRREPSRTRIAVEALANVQRHARAGEAHVLFAERDGGLYLRIRDDGIGIPAETVAPGTSA
jgi:signal transduction histidine kinase